jgi:hypothetical protein
MHIVVNVAWKVVIHDLSDIGNVKTATGHISANHHWRISALEGAEGIFTFTLTLISMDGTSRKASTAKDIFDIVTGTFCLDKN